MFIYYINTNKKYETYFFQLLRRFALLSRRRRRAAAGEVHAGGGAAPGPRVLPGGGVGAHRCAAWVGGPPGGARRALGTHPSTPGVPILGRGVGTFSQGQNPTHPVFQWWVHAPRMSGQGGKVRGGISQT